ncbi:MAG: hypothetical protein PHT51_01230 [Patescibacteria group bacterium]|nr:hypothetical protein [Patescibacteria group bacterium]MDD4610496.1 hypothetical protein [Patescibacteria group bacterium]
MANQSVKANGGQFGSVPCSKHFLVIDGKVVKILGSNTPAARDAAKNIPGSKLWWKDWSGRIFEWEEEPSIREKREPKKIKKETREESSAPLVSGALPRRSSSMLSLKDLSGQPTLERLGIRKYEPPKQSRHLGGRDDLGWLTRKPEQPKIIENAQGFVIQNTSLMQRVIGGEKPTEKELANLDTAGCVDKTVHRRGIRDE